MNYKGVIIEESLKDKSVLQKIKILSTKVEEVTEKHKTPWLKQWTLHVVEIPEDQAELIAEELSRSINDNPSSWYVDYNNGETFFVVYPNKIFKWKRGETEIIKACKEYGISLGIPPYQVDFPIE